MLLLELGSTLKMVVRSVLLEVCFPVCFPEVLCRSVALVPDYFPTARILESQDAGWRCGSLRQYVCQLPV